MLVFLAVAVLFLTADLVMKNLAFRHVAPSPVDVSGIDRIEQLPAHEPVTVIPRVLSLKLMLNRGAAFGLGKGGRWIFVVVGVVAIAIIASVFWSSRASARVLHVALGLLLAGAVGNLYDRLQFGHVRDMLWLFPGVRLPFGLHWPGGSDQLYPWIFNVADAAMCVGLGLLLVLMFCGRKHEA